MHMHHEGEVAKILGRIKPGYVLVPSWGFNVTGAH